MLNAWSVANKSRSRKTRYIWSRVNSSHLLPPRRLLSSRLSSKVCHRGRRIVWGWFMVDGEVNNGGFNQLFWNDSRRSVSLAREAFQLIGATDHLQLLDEAVARLDANLDRFKRYAVLRTLDAFSESYAEGVFDDLDRRYFDLDADPLLVAYIRSHPEEFAA